ncbi:TRAP transporter substrate-binding protein [Paracoccaceae bacterium]|nr:TRAP transporter substrate-binding protein [Paracoccaceae bacterium]
MERRKFLKGAAIGATGAALAAPAVAGGHVKTMTIVSTWGRDTPGLGISAQRFAERVTNLSDGAITTEYFAANERVGAFDVFDEVAAGNSQAYIAADYYFTGKHPAFNFFTSVPFGLTHSEHAAWIKFGGGQELWDKLSGQFGIKPLLVGATGTQAGGWFNKEINGPDDFKGLKMRIPGLGGNVLVKLGASTISLPGPQIYENLVSGAIDATEWVGPYNDYFAKFHEAAKYYYTGGFHEPGSDLCLGTNKSWWESLTPWEQSIIEAAAHQEAAAMYEEAISLNGDYLTKLVEEHGVEIKEFNDETFDAFYEAWLEVLEETKAHSDLAAEVADAYMTAVEKYGGFLANFETRLVNQRNRVMDLG